MNPRQRVLELLRRHGWNATSFQSLETGFHYWFEDALPDGDSDACVAYVETGSAWVVAGAPICAPERVGLVAQRFIAAARQARRRCAFFGAEARLVESAALPSMLIGEQPVWDPAAWQTTLAQSRSLREQLRRARNKGVGVRRVGAAELAADPSLRRSIETLIERWQQDKPMAPMGFLVDVQPFEFAEERRFFVAERDGALVGFIAAVPIYSRGGWLLEDFLRDPSAPNGTAELLIDVAMRALADEGSHYVTMGLAPLSGPVSGWLRTARRVSSALYDFSGLRAFKAKLRPHAWEKIYLAHPPGTSSHLGLLDALAAFARGSFLRFGGATLLRGPALIVRVLAMLLIPWTVLLAVVSPGWFPTPWVRTTWLAFDTLLVLVLFALTIRWRHGLGAVVASAITLDAVLTAIQLAVYNAPRARGSDWLVLAISLAAPMLASVVLWGAVGHRRLSRQVVRSS
jgi:phosphatidylglycerol lysyltransferase